MMGMRRAKAGRATNEPSSLSDLRKDFQERVSIGSVAAEKNSFATVSSWPGYAVANRSPSFFAQADRFGSALSRQRQVFEREQPLEVVTHAHQQPFQIHFDPPSQQKSPKADHCLDNPERRLHGLLAQFVK